MNCTQSNNIFSLYIWRWKPIEQKNTNEQNNILKCEKKIPMKYLQKLQV